MQFKDLGSLFNGFDEFKFKHANKASSFADLDGIDKNTIRGMFKIDDSGISDFTSAQIQAKASTIGLTDSLTDELMAMSKDADFTSKAKVGKVTWGEALKENSVSAEQLGNALLKSNDVTDKTKTMLKNCAKEFGTTGEDYKRLIENIIEGNASFDDISGKFTTLGADVQKSTGMFESAGNVIKGFFASVKGYIPIIAAVGAAYGAYKLWEHSQTGYTRASEKLDKSSSNYENTKSELSSLNQELDTTKSKIEELQSLKDAGTISLSDEAELERLQRQNNELENQVKLKEQLAETQAKIVAQDAKTVAETPQTYTEAMKEQHGNVIGTLMGLIGGYTNPEMGITKSAADTWAEENGGKNGSATIEQQMKANIKNLKQYKKDLKKAQKEGNQAAIDTANSNISNVTDLLQNESSTIQSWIDKSKDANGNVLKSMAGHVRDWNKLLSDYSDMDLSKVEKSYKNLENYFSNSTAGESMKAYLEDIVKNGGSAQDALDAFRASGMRLNDIGVNSSTFLRYFEEVKKAAEDASESVKSVDGSFEGMKNASETANQGANYDSTMGFYKTAKEDYKKGLWGTDDFQTVAQFAVGYDIGKKLKDNADAYKYASDAYKEAWENGGSQLMERWYGNEDELVNMTHVLEDFKNAGLASSGSNGEWLFENADGSMKFKTTAEAAEKLHTSVDNVEVAMSKLEEHGFEFDGIEKSGKLLNDYKENLDGLKTIYDSLSEGDDKDRIGKLIEGYDSEYAKFQEDMSGLSQDQIVNIKFEYDLATIKQQIQELKETASATGDNQDWAAVTVAQKQAIKKLEEQTGITEDSDKGYENSKSKIKELRESTKGMDADERAAVNEKISAIQTMEQNWLDFRNNGGKLDWNEYLNTAEATKAFDDIMQNSTLTANELKDLFGDNATIEYTAEIKNESELKEKLESLKKGESITFSANVDNIDDTAVRAIKNEDGTITYKADIAGAEKEVNKIVDKDGNIKYTADFDGSNLDWLNDNLKNGETITFNADVGGVEKEINAYKDSDGQIHYSADIDDATKDIEAVKNQDGSITYKVKVNKDEAKESLKPLTEQKPQIQLSFDKLQLQKEIQDAKDAVEKESFTCSIDLKNRPKVDSSKLKEAGWEDAGDGTATVFSSSFSNESKDKTVVVTPILPNGDVLSPDALSQYADGLLNGASDDKGVQLRTYVGEDSIDKSDRYAESLHKVQEAYYMGSDAQREAMSSLQGYSAEQLKSINLYDDQRQTGESALLSVMNALDISKESASEFIDVLTDMGMVSPEIDMDVNDDDAQASLASLMNTLYGVPTDITTELLANDKASDTAIQTISNLTGIPTETLTQINATDGASGVLAQVISYVTGIPPQVITNLLATDDGASAVASMVTGNINNVPNNHHTVLKAKDNASPAANAAKAAIDGVKGKDVGIGGYVKSTLSAAVAKAKAMVASIAGGGDNLLGTAHIKGTAGLYPIPRLSSRALAMGTLSDTSWLRNSWKTDKSEYSLTGEKGQELVVHGNRWWTVGDNGAEFSAIPQGSVVFNHKQTEELFSKGYTNSRGLGNPFMPGLPAFVSGTAYIAGGRLPTSSSSSSSKKKTSSTKSSSKSSGSSSSSSSGKSSSSNNSSSSAEKETENLVDFIKILYDRVSRLADLAEKAIDRAVGLVNKQNAATDAIAKVQNEMSTAQSAANKYLEQANAVNLSEDYKRKIREGQLSIDDIRDNDLNDKISKYKEYYENYLEYQDKVFDLQDKISDLAEKRLSIIEDEYDAITDIQSSLQSRLESERTLLENLGTSIDNHLNTDSISEAIKSQTEVYNQLTKKLNDYQNEVNSQLSSGLLKEGSKAYQDAMKNLQDFSANITKASSDLIELQDKLNQIKYDTIQYIIDGFERSSDKISSYIDLLESRNETVPESEYQKQLDNNNSQIKQQYDLRSQYLKEQAYYDVGSTRYQDLAKKINEADTSILKLQKDNEDLKDSIYSLRIKNLEDAIQGYDDLETELKGFRDLLNDDAFLDKNGGITDEGLAQITLLSQSIGNAKQKISDLTTGLQKVKELYDNGVISLEEYNDKSAEYRKEIQSSASDVKSYQKSLTDLYQNALKTEVDALQKVISKRKEAAQAKEDYYSYDKKIREQSNDVNAIKAQIAALQGVTLFAPLNLFNCGDIPITLSCYNGIGNGKRECGTSL